MRSRRRPCQPKQRSVFWRSWFTWPLRAGKRANANFAVRRGFFCVQCAAPPAGAAVFAKPAAVVRTFAPGAPAFFLPVCRRLVPGLWAACSFCVWLGLACAACRLPAMRLCVRGFRCRCLACLARRAGVQGGAAARRLCVRLPAGAPSCGFVSGLRVLPLLRRLSCPLPCLPSVCFLARVYSFIFCPFLPHFCLSKIFSLVAQAATGLYFLPKRK